MEYLGTLFFEEKVSSDLQYSINRLNNSGINVWIVSGDSKDNVVNVGKSLDMVKPNKTSIEFNKEDNFDDIDIKMNLYLLQLVNKSNYKNKKIEITREEAMIRLKTISGKDIADKTTNSISKNEQVKNK